MGDLQSPALPLGDGAFDVPFQDRGRVAATPCSGGAIYPGPSVIGSEAAQRDGHVYTSSLFRTRHDSRNSDSTALVQPATLDAEIIIYCAFTGALMSRYCAESHAMHL